MGLAPFLIVLAGGDDGGGGSGRRRSGRRHGIGIDGYSGIVGEATEDRHQAGDDDEERPAVIKGDDVEGVQEEEDADENYPDGAAKSTEEPLLVARGAVIGETAASVGHLVDEEPDTDPDQEEGNEPVNGETVKHVCVGKEEEAAESDEADGARGKPGFRGGGV